MAGDAHDTLGAAGAARTSDRTIGGRYRLDTVLGRGGMGVVWAAHDELLDRDVAVKEVIAPGALDDAERELLRARTLREARTAARISAEGIVAILDVVLDDGRPWIVMERLPARTLEDELTERHGLPPREVAEIAASLLAGLAAAHAAGILHRDVKPSNVMFRPTPRGPRAVLGDFGIAHLDGDATLTATGQLMGSPAYVAPERARGETATTASDLWSVGVTLWAAVEGWSPFQRVNSLASLTAVITEDPPPAVHAGPLAPLLDGLLRKDPRARIDVATARALVDHVLAPPVPTTRALPLPATTPSGPPPAPPSIPPRTGGGTRPVTEPGPVPGPVPAPAPDPVRGPVAHPAAARADEDEASGAGPAPWWSPGREPAGDEPPPRRGRTVPAVLAALVTLGLVGLGAAQLLPDTTPGGAGTQAATPGDGLGGRTQPSAGADATGDQPAGAAGVAEGAPDPAVADPAPAEQPEDAPGAGATTDEAAAGTGGAGASGDPADPAGAAAAAAVPDGFERYSDPSGFSVAVPAGWQPEREGSRVYLHDPASAAYLLVDQTDEPKPDPVADWRQQEPAVARRLEGYQRIGEIVPVDYRGWLTADWEFVFGPGQRTHVLNRGFITGPDKAYALYWSVPSSMWEAMLPVREQVVASFQPAG